MIESIAELLEYGARPHPTFRAVADGEPDAEIALLPYVKQVVRNKIRQGWRREIRHQRAGQALSEASPEANIIYPDFELRSDLERIRAMIVELKLSAGERAVADVYLDEAMRQEEDARLEIDPLDPQAELALRRCGDDLLARLEAGRVGLASSPSAAEADGGDARRRWGWRHWSGVAAALVALGIATRSLIPLPSKSPDVPSATPAPGEPAHGSGDDWSVGPIASPAIPEPSGALLTLLGGVILLGRRRRPYV